MEKSMSSPLGGAQGKARNQNPRSSVPTNVATGRPFHVGLEPWALKSSFRNFQKVDLSNISEKCTIEPFRRRNKQQDDLQKEAGTKEARVAKCIAKGATSVHSIYVTSADDVREDMPICFDTREFLSRACERSSVLTNTDPQLVLRLESACVTESAQQVLEHGFWVVYLKSFQRKSGALLEQFRERLLRSWVDFFATVPMPKEPVADRFCPILVEALLFIFTEAFPKSRSLVTDRSFAVYVYRCVYRELLGVSLASVTVDRLRANHVTSPRDSESPRGVRQAPSSPAFRPSYHRDAYINGDEGAISTKHLWWDPEEDPRWEDDARKAAIRHRAALEAGITPPDFSHASSSAITEDHFVTTLVSPAVHSMSKRKNLRFANDPGRRVRVGEYHGRGLDLRIQPKRTRPVIQSKEEVPGSTPNGPGASTGSTAPLNRSGTSPAALQGSSGNSKDDKGTPTDLLSFQSHRLVLAETYAKKREAKERERFLPPKYIPLELELREVLKERQALKEEKAQENARNARLLDGRRGAVQASHTSTQGLALHAVLQGQDKQAQPRKSGEALDV